MIYSNYYVSVKRKEIKVILLVEKQTINIAI